ncbi:MAG: ATP phosphoribosyltransferase regulatory subunit [Alphaproteobacteria bacterium]|nr:ATP phosphoribosyltransferase regulatory subunit [Alphaproteobacteria bacterium]
MNSFDHFSVLLPNGFEDLLPPDAEQEARAITILMDHFAGHGYRRVKPPLVEFEDSLLAPGPGAALASETFRLMDPVSHRMMGVRSDITAQIARIASSRLFSEPRPLRLAYANDILRTRASQQRTQRQFCQVGCELIGHDDLLADIEICLMAVSALKALGLADITLDLTLPRLTNEIMKLYNLSDAARTQVRAALEKREQDSLDALDPAPRESLKALLSACGPADTALDQLARMDLPAELRPDIDRLAATCTALSKALDELGITDIRITIDPVENKGFEYHAGTAFALFAKKARAELGRGGRYDIVCGQSGDRQSATGFTLYMDTLRGAMPASKPADTLFVPSTESWATIKTLRDDGWRVIHGTGQDDRERLQCTHELLNGQIHPIG